MPIEETSVENLAEYVDWVLTSGGPQVRWFRGQGCAHRKLLPSLWRRTPALTTGEVLNVESRLLTRFRQRSLPLWPEGYPQTDWEHLFAMQHFGIPTRLLDWSENALTAAYFAGDHRPELCECASGSCAPTVWVLDPVEFNRANARFKGYGDAITVLTTSESTTDPWKPGTEEVVMAPDPVAIYGTHNSTRIAAQQGTFTVSGKDRTPLEEGVDIQDRAGVLVKITLKSSGESLLAELSKLGITRSTVYPDLQGLGADIAKAELP